MPNEKGTLVTLKFRIKADPKPEIQWFKGMDKIQDSAKFSQKFTTLKESNEYEIALEIQDPSAEDGGDYKCLVKNDHGQLQAKLNLNIGKVLPHPLECNLGLLFFQMGFWKGFNSNLGASSSRFVHFYFT